MGYHQHVIAGNPDPSIGQVAQNVVKIILRNSQRQHAAIVIAQVVRAQRHHQRIVPGVELESDDFYFLVFTVVDSKRIGQIHGQDGQLQSGSARVWLALGERHRGADHGQQQEAGNQRCETHAGRAGARIGTVSRFELEHA